MNLVLLLLAAVVSFSLLHFWGVPAARRKLGRATGTGTVAAAGIFALADVCRTIILLVAVATLACVALIGAAEFGGKGNLGQVQAAVRMVGRWRALLEQVSPVLSFMIAALCGLGLLLLGRRGARVKVAGMLAAADRAEAEQILEQLRAGTATELPDTAPMAEIRTKLGTIEGQIGSLQQTVDAETDQQRKTEIEKVLAERRQLMEVGVITLLRMDIERRRAPPKPAADIIPAPTNRWEQVQDILFSRGTLSTMNGAARVVFAGAMLLMVPSLLGVETVPTGIDLSQVEIHLNLIEMNLQGDAAEQQWQQVAAAAPAPAATALNDDQALDQLAQLYDHGVALHFVRIGELADHHVSNVRLSETREHILSAAAQHTTDRSALPALDNAAHSPTERLYLEMAMPQPPLSAEAAKFREDLKREVMQRQPDVWRKIKGRVEGLTRSFTEPIDRGMMRGMMVARVASAGLGASDVLPPELETLGSGIEGAVAEDAYRIRSRKFLASIMLTPNGDAAIKAIDDGLVPTRLEVERDRMVARRLQDTDALEDRLAAEPPRFPVAADPHAHEASSIANALMTTSPQVAEAERFSDSLATFEDFFPGHVGAERTTARGILLEAHNIKPSIPSGVLARMAGNFSLLRGFSRIGGVLIGQDATNGNETLDFVDLSWEALPRGIGLTFTRADGVKIELEPRPRSLVAQALTYAADGRPVTATMTRATPLKDLKILVHPTLVDTGVGCRAIEIDRFVDTFLSENPTGKDVEIGMSKALYDVEVYDYAQRAFSLGYIENFRLTDTVKRIKDELIDEFEWLSSRVKLDNVDAKELFDPQRSPLTVKKEFFEQNVVRGIGECLSSANGAIDEFGKCMIRTGKDFSGEVQGVFHEATEFIPWSGVRERAWSLDKDLAFAKEGPVGDTLYPFDFVEQLAALGPANFAPEQGAYVDPQPFTFPAYQQMVSEIVIKGISGDNDARAILDDMRQFTLLERVFRAALAGQLGTHFPVEKLGSLADETGAAVKTVRTPRWTPHPGSLEEEYLLRMHSVANGLKVANVYSGLVEQESSCWAAIKDKTLTDIAHIPDSEWAAQCDLTNTAKQYPELDEAAHEGPTVRAAALVRLSATLRKSRELRVTLGIPAEEQAMRARISADGPMCPPL